VALAVDTFAYRAVPGRFDEALDAAGELRPAWAKLQRSLGPADPAAMLDRQRQLDRLLDAEGAGHLVHELALERVADRRGVGVDELSSSRPWRLDPLPFMVDGDEFAVLSAGVVQRMRVLEAFLADAYGQRSLLRDRAVPADQLFSWRSFRPTSGGPGATRRWLVHYAVDVTRDATGQWRIVQDLTDAPSGLGYSLLNRLVMARLLPDAVRIAGVAPIHEHADALRRALTACAPTDRRSPRCVVLTAGPGHPSYVEHSYLATRLGYHLAEGADLVMRQGRLWLRALDGLEPIDVVYRRTEDAALDPLEGRTQRGRGVPGIVWGARRGGLTLANGYGSGVAEEPDLGELLDGVSRRVLGEPLLLQQLEVGTPLATSPVFTSPVFGTRGDDAYAAAEVVLRLQLVAGPDGISVMPGAAGRVLSVGDSPSLPTSHLVKDVWVVGGTVAPIRLPLRVAAPPQVDFGMSVPKRAADAMYWLGRSAERAEVVARTVREVGTQIDRDPSLRDQSESGWSAGVTALLRAAQGTSQTRVDPVRDDIGEPNRRPVAVELRNASDVVAAKLAVVVQEATSVREFMSTTMGRVLGRLARVRAELIGADAAADDLDLVLVDLAALAGLATESTVRGPAWRFLDLGRRIERALAVLGSVEAALGVHVDHVTFQLLAEAALSSNESLVAYRRRYRSDVDLDAVVELLVSDDTNPRSLTYQLDRLREHAAALAWADGLDLVERASIGALAPLDSTVANGRRLSVDALVLGVRAPLLQLSDSIAARWFADPVSPTVMGTR
jgi:uncharacterized circularly permuted ATP-grasp superfamily protein/uncharacterized alpha-E superfamily protein